MKKLLAANRLRKIPYLTSPNSNDIIYLTPEEAEQKFGFSYDESLYGDPNQLQGYLNNPVFCQELRNNPDLPSEQAIRERLANPLQDIAICDYGPKLGHGLCALKDIPANTVLFLYAGEINDATHYSGDNDYRYVWVHLGNKTPVQTINAKEQGGLARFMQHLPVDKHRHKDFLSQSLRQKFDPLIQRQEIGLDQLIDKLVDKLMQPLNNQDTELEDIEFFDPNIRKNLATRNAAVKYTALDNIPIAVCSTEYPIKKGDQIGISYGWDYWESSGEKPRYTTQDGLLISESAYRYIKAPISYPVYSYPREQNNTNPYILYQKSIRYFNEKNYQLAINMLNEALPLYKEKVGEASIECAKCYSTLASCYRDLGLGDIKTAIDYCEQAITIFYSLDKDALAKVTEKYHGCLNKTLHSPSDIYHDAVAQINGKKYAIALAKLFFVLKRYQETHEEKEQATCHSSIASCYRELNEMDQALVHCQKAVDLRTKHYGEQHPKTLKVKEKLAQLEEKLPPKQTMSLSK